MKKFLLLIVSCAFVVTLHAQTESFDLVSYTPPAGWQKEVRENLVLYSIIDQQKKTWCQIAIVKSTISKGTIEQDFESEWNELVVKNYNPSEPPQLEETQEKDGWKIKTGTAAFVFNNSNAFAMITTMSGFERCASIVVTTNCQDYMNEIEATLASVDLKKMTTQPVQVIPGSPTPGNFAFNTTNFDDGWTSTIHEDWVQVIKGNSRVLVHYPNKAADTYNSVLLDGLKNAWNILVAPKYSSITNFICRPVSGWEPIEFAEADAVDLSTGRQVYVVLFKKNYSGGNGRYMEFITPDKASFEAVFGAFHQESYGWEKMENMVTYNRFAIAAPDLVGKWSSDFTGAIQYVNSNTGLDAGMASHASSENFHFINAQDYNWDLGVASGMVGNIKFQSVKSGGKFSMVGNWQVNFSDMEGKPRTYNAYFSCIKGLRILWLDGKPFAKVE